MRRSTSAKSLLVRLRRRFGHWLTIWGVTGVLVMLGAVMVVVAFLWFIFGTPHPLHTTFLHGSVMLTDVLAEIVVPCLSHVRVTPVMERLPTPSLRLQHSPPTSPAATIYFRTPCEHSQLMAASVDFPTEALSRYSSSVPENERLQTLDQMKLSAKHQQKQLTAGSSDSGAPQPPPTLLRGSVELTTTDELQSVDFGVVLLGPDGKASATVAALSIDRNNWTRSPFEAAVPLGTKRLRLELWICPRTRQPQHGLDSSRFVRGLELATFLVEPPAGSLRCRMLCRPIVNYVQQNTVVLLWETNCNADLHQVWVGPSAEKLMLHREGPVRSVQTHASGSHFVHHYTLDVPAQARGAHKRRATLFYRVHSGAASSEVHELRLPWRHWSPSQPIESSIDDPILRVGVLGDSQSGALLFRHHLFHMAQRQPEMLIHLGDMVQESGRIKEWRTYWSGPLEVDRLGSTVPVLVVRGNHDGSTPLSHAYSALPSNRRYYATTVFHTRFIVLDANLDPTGGPEDEQTRWLRRELQSRESASARFRVVLVHIPPYVEYWDPKAWANGESDWGKGVRTVWAPLFERLAVDLVMSGHSHIFQFGTRGQVAYSILGGGGGKLDRTRVVDWGLYATTILEHHYAMLVFRQTTLTLETFNDADQMIHRHTLVGQAAILKGRH